MTALPASTSTGSTTITATLTKGLFGAVAMAGGGSLAVVARATHNGAAALTGHATGTAAGALVLRGAGARTGGATITAAPSVIRTLAGALTPHVTPAALATMDLVVAGTVPAVATVVGASAIDRLVAGTAPASTSVVGNAEITAGVAVALVGHGAMVGAGKVIIAAGGTAAAHSGIGAALAGKIMDVGGSVAAISGVGANPQYIRDMRGAVVVGSYVVADVYVGAYLDIAGVAIAHSSVRVAGTTQTVAKLDVRGGAGETIFTMRPALRLPSPFAPLDLTFTFVMGLRSAGLDTMDPPLIPGPVLDDGFGHFAPQPVIRLDIVVAGPTIDVVVPMAAATGILPSPDTIVLFASDQLPSLRPTFVVNGQALNLAGATIRMLLRKVGLESLVYTGSEALLSVISVGLGIAEFDWNRALTAPGDYEAHFQILDAAGRLLHSPALGITLEQSL